MRQMISDAEYLLQLFVVVDDDDVTSRVIGDVLTGVGGVRRVDASGKAPEK
jgi:hypothetical protein